MVCKHFLCSQRKCCHKKRPAQRPAEFREAAQALCDNLLADKNDSFVLNLSFFGETTLLAIIPNITIVK